MTELEKLIIDYGEHTRWAGYYSEGELADKKNADAVETLAKIKRALTEPVAPAVDARYTMDQMRDYALAFHKSRIDASGDDAMAQGVFSPFNACMYRDECRARASAQTELALTDDEVWQALKDIADLHSHPDDVVQAGRALLAAAQPASGETE